MKKIYKIWILIIWFILLTWLVYATVTVASVSKSSELPWQWTSTYDSAHNVGTSSIAELRFSFDSWGSVWWDSVIFDSVTWLYWQSAASIDEKNICKTYDTNSFTDRACDDWTSLDDCSWCAARDYCEDLVLWWYTDWRLPNIKELKSIIDFNRYDPIVDTTYFTAANDDYWSSTVNANPIYYAFKVYFDNGGDTSGMKDGDAFVRCVR